MAASPADLLPALFPQRPLSSQEHRKAGSHKQRHPPLRQRRHRLRAAGVLGLFWRPAGFHALRVRPVEAGPNLRKHGKAPAWGDLPVRRARVQIVAGSALGIALLLQALLLQVLLFLAGSGALVLATGGAALVATQQRRPAAA